MDKKTPDKGRPQAALDAGPDAPAAGNGSGPQDAQGHGPRVGGYIRVSQERNLRNFGMDAQLAEVQRYATFRRWEVGKVYRENGVSGYKRKRPALDRLLADAGAGKLDVVVFPSIDRAARSVIDPDYRATHGPLIGYRDGSHVYLLMGPAFKELGEYRARGRMSAGDFSKRTIMQQLLENGVLVRNPTKSGTNDVKKHRIYVDGRRLWVIKIEWAKFEAQAG